MTLGMRFNLGPPAQTSQHIGPASASCRVVFPREVCSEKCRAARLIHSERGKAWRKEMPKHCLVTGHSNPRISHTHKSHYNISKGITEIPLWQKLLDIKLD